MIMTADVMTKAATVMDTMRGMFGSDSELGIAIIMQ